MKKITLLFALLFAAVCALQAQVTVSGEITTNTTWTKNNTYLLSGFVYVEDGATLTIEAGTVIKGEKATKGALIITRTGKIQAQGTPNEPIVFTSNESAPSYGDWGGIIILGNAPTNTSTNGVVGEGTVEGGVDTPEGDGRYGGSNANDNSGVLSYVRIEYPGIAFQPNNEINGLTMAGVGRGTTIDHVQVSYANDDSFEWFGGTVNCKYLIAYRGLDDDFDADFGYGGKVQFAFSQRDPQVADISGSNGFEVDNDASGSSNTPKTKPMFSNVTVVGPTGTVAADYRRAAHLRRNNEIKLFNSVFIGAYPDAGLLIDGQATVDQAILDSLTVRNSFFHGMTTPLKTTVAAFDIAAWSAARENSVGPNAADAQLVDPFNLEAPNPRPSATSPVLGYAKYTDSRIANDFFFTKVGYAGAFGPVGDWTAPWSRFGQNLDQVGLAPAPEVTVSGFITENTTWTADKTYVLNGFVYVKNCVTLTIEPGTVIKGDKGTKGALIVTRCAKIIADGTADQPIVFTSSEENPTYGDWGGVIILGKAPVNTSANGVAGEGVIEGGVNNQFGDGLYGGTDAADNSGILRYVRIEYPGIAFQPNNEINGLTMGGVGRGTVIDHVQVSYSGDDSFEWFGGTVDAKFLIAYRGVDDDFDADFGYSGRIQFAYAQRDPQVADISGSNGLEIDNDASGTAATPKTRILMSNVTVVGPDGANIAADYRRAAHLRRNSEPKVFNSVFVGGYPVGLLIDGATTAANATLDSLTVRNSFFHGMATPLSDNDAAFDVVAWAAAHEVVGSTNSADAQLSDPFNLELPNPRPANGSPVIGAAKFTDARINNFFFTKVNYAGAFGPSGDWTASWSRFGADLSQIGLAPAQGAEVAVAGFITDNTTWTANNTYVLNGFVYVKNCATLTIEPGTVIKGDKATKGALIVTRCAKLIADGTQEAPIVFTSAEESPEYGDWGGVIILGTAPTNTSTNGVSNLGVIEGGVNNQFGDGLYGGGDQPGGGNAADNSGILRYVRIEYPGIAFQPNNEINGLTMGGVGSGTTIDHVQVSYANDDAFEWFGGTVNAKHLIAYRALDDDFDADFGYSGNVQFGLIVRDPQVADISGSNGFEIDNDGSSSSNTPKTKPTFSNVTLVGPTGAGIAADYRRAAHLRRNSEPGLFNTLLIGNYPVGLFIDGTSTAGNAQTGLLEVKNTWVVGPTQLLNTTDAAFNIGNWFTTTGWANGQSADVTAAQLQDAFNLDAPNAQPKDISPAVAPNAASFASARVSGAFFDKVDYVGAFDGTDDWTCGWAKFLVLNTDCFVDTKDADNVFQSIRLMPTVTRDQATLEVNLATDANLQVEIYNLNGQYMGQQVAERGFAGKQVFTLNTVDLTSGFYLVRVQAGSAVKVLKMIKM